MHHRSTRPTYGWLAFDAAAHAAFTAGALIVQLFALKLVFGVLASVMTASVFAWAHLAAHGALFGLTRKAEILGTLVMLPSVQMYRLWSYGHNEVNHGFTSLSPVDWIWLPWTPDGYESGVQHPGPRWPDL